MKMKDTAVKEILAAVFFMKGKSAQKARRLSRQQRENFLLEIFHKKKVFSVLWRNI